MALGWKNLFSRHYLLLENVGIHTRIYAWYVFCSQTPQTSLANASSRAKSSCLLLEARYMSLFYDIVLFLFCVHTCDQVSRQVPCGGGVQRHMAQVRVLRLSVHVTWDHLRARGLTGSARKHPSGFRQRQ